MAMVTAHILLAIVLLSHYAACQTDMAHSRVVQCNLQRTSWNETRWRYIDSWARRLARDMTREENTLQGYLGTIAVIGTGTERHASLYFTAMAALKAGADRVHIFCYSRSEQIMKSFSPDITVHAILDTAVDEVIRKLANVDLVILGPGLDNSGHSIAHVIPKVINHCKGSKPLVLDLREDLLVASAHVFDHLLKYPAPGVVFTPNRVEFERLYDMMKSPLVAADKDLRLDFDKYGRNVFVLRKSCFDVGISAGYNTSWISPEYGSAKRSVGQGNVLAGVLGTYYLWASKIIPQNVSEQQGDMFVASVAAYAAAKVTRQACAMANNDLNRSMMTSDVLRLLSNAINDPTDG